MNPQRGWSIVGLFIIALVISIPVYSADALAASVQITKNSGEAGIRGYLDAQGDTWTVEATISGVPDRAINPNDVKIKIGANEADFTSCTETALGATCEYISPLTDGISEAEYAFQVIYNFLNALSVPDSVSNGEVIRSDGSAPGIQIHDVRQNSEGKIQLDFTVDDSIASGAPSVGIKTIEMVDPDTGNVLQTISIDAPGRREYNYLNDGQFSGILQASLSGQQVQRIKIRAQDWLGHSGTSAIQSFPIDFVAPAIQDNLNFTAFGQFVGNFVTRTDITLDIVESSIPVVKGYSGLASLNGEEADCDEDPDEVGVWHCAWRNVEVNPRENSISVQIIAEDEFGNIAERNLVESFTRDTSLPRIQFFGTERMFEGKSYVKSGNQRILLAVDEQGAGITANGIRANLDALGRSSSEAPTFCNQTLSIFSCYWDTSKTFSSDGVARIGLSKFEDNVGNEAEKPELELAVDTTGPKVETMEAYGVSDVGDKDYFQSNDRLKIKFKALESSGLTILVNANDLIMDAETLFPENEFTRDISPTTGWQVFSEQSCERAEGGAWDCEIITDPIKSGPERGVRVDIRIQDTAGNDANSWPTDAKNVEWSAVQNSKGTLTFDLLGLSLEENPDYWEVSRVVPLGGLSNFIDLDIAPLTYTRMPFEIRLEKSGTTAEAVNIELRECVPTQQQTAAPPGGRLDQNATPTVLPTPVVSRALLYAGVSPQGDTSPRPKIVLEFEPFDGVALFNLAETGGEEFTTREVGYMCTFQIFSAVDGNALARAELQEVTVSVPFGFSTLGAPDANLEEIIKNEREAASTGFWGVIGTLEKIIKWLRYIAGIATVIIGAAKIVNALESGTDNILRETPASGSMIATCLGMNGAVDTADTAATALSVPLSILSCKADTGLGWYDTWVGAIPEKYNQLMNIEILKSPTSPLGKDQQAWKPARSVYDNLYLSIAALCVPGLVHNLDKYRQIKCRKIYCLENEVKANLATVESCSELEGLLTCKYFIGELWYILPFSQFYDGIINLLRNALKDPLALAHTATILGCGISCAVSGTLSSACNLLYFLWDVIDWIEGTVSFIITIADDLEQGGLSYCESVL